MSNPSPTQIIWLDPSDLVAHPANVRSDLESLDELAASIAATGVVEPLIVTSTGDGYRILAGHRRAAAATLAGTLAVPCWERPDLADADADQLALALAENLQRSELDALDEARSYAQLSAFEGWDAERIATVVGRPARRVRERIAAAALPDLLAERVVTGLLTLEQVAALEEFADDTATYQRLAALSGPAFDAELKRALRRRKVAERRAQSLASLDAAGVALIGRPSYRDEALVLSYLQDDLGTDLDAELHAKCPGHAAYIDPVDGEARYVCRQPKAYGHSTPPWYRHLSAEEAAEMQAAEDAAQARRADLEAACEVRRSFVRRAIAAKRPPKGTLRFAVEVLVGDIQDQLPDLDDIAWYLGHDDVEDIDLAEALDQAIQRASDARLPSVLLALVAGVAEANLARCDARWGYQPVLGRRYLGFLAAAGHELSGIETELAGVVTAHDDEDVEEVA